jgi:transposase
LAPPGDALAHRTHQEDRPVTAPAPRTHRQPFPRSEVVSSGVAEGLNNNAKVTMRKSYGFCTFRCLELALYHSLGKLSEPKSTHDFF